MKEATSLKEGGETVASKFGLPVHCKRLQIKSTYLRAFRPAPVCPVLNGIVEAIGR